MVIPKRTVFQALVDRVQTQGTANKVEVDGHHRTVQYTTHDGDNWQVSRDHDGIAKIVVLMPKK